MIGTMLAEVHLHRAKPEAARQVLDRVWSLTINVLERLQADNDMDYRRRPAQLLALHHR